MQMGEYFSLHVVIMIGQFSQINQQIKLILITCIIKVFNIYVTQGQILALLFIFTDVYLVHGPLHSLKKNEGEL